MKFYTKILSILNQPEGADLNRRNRLAKLIVSKLSFTRSINPCEYIMPILLCFLSQYTAYAAPVNVYVGTSIGFQRGSSSLNGGTLFDPRPVLPILRVVTHSYPGRIGQSDPVGNLFFEVDAKVNDCFSIGFSPYYHLNNFEITVTRNGDLSAYRPLGAPFDPLVEAVEFSVHRRHTYGLLFVPKMHFKEVTLYGLLGAEFCRFKAGINRSLNRQGQTIGSANFPKGVFSSAAVIGLGVSRELGNWSLFAEGHYKHYQVKRFGVDHILPNGTITSQFLKFSPKFVSIMFGVKFKFI